MFDMILTAAFLAPLAVAAGFHLLPPRGTKAAKAAARNLRLGREAAERETLRLEAARVKAAREYAMRGGR